MLIEELYKKYAEELGLELIAGEEGLQRRLKSPEIERPGLSLTGYVKGLTQGRILIFGKGEISYLKTLSTQKCRSILKQIFTVKTPFILVARRLRPIPAMIEACEELKIPLFRSHFPAMDLLSVFLALLRDECAPCLSCHGSLVEIFGVGVLIQGDAAIGKSEAALGLIERGHRLVSDDIVKIKKCGGKYLEGFGVDISRSHMEIKGIGIINIARLYGAVSVKEKKSLDIVVKLQVWNDSHFYDRNGQQEESVSFLGVKVPFHLLPVKPGRDVVLLLETIALNHRLKILSRIEKKG